jgi:hypothetical protein
MNYLGAPEGEQFAYRFELVAADGRRVQTYSGIARYAGKPVRWTSTGPAAATSRRCPTACTKLA